MPQELRVVRCCDCGTFQLDIAKKMPKWTCKVCNLKQSLQKIYHMGTGKACRQVVQELNMRRGQSGWKQSPSEGGGEDQEEFCTASTQNISTSHLEEGLKAFLGVDGATTTNTGIKQELEFHLVE